VISGRTTGWVAALAASATLGVSLPAVAQPTCGIGTPGQTVPVQVGSTGRSMLLHVPAKAQGRRLPLVFLFHGSGGTGADMLESSGLAATADRYGFLLAAPDAGIPAGAGFAWNIPGVPTVTGKVPTADDPDDVAFVKAAIDWLDSRGCVDAARVYATGLSGGGRMASLLACVAADRFAAVSPVVGLRAGNPLPNDPSRPDPATCQPSRPMPVLAFAGDADRVNPVDGGGAPYWQYPMSAALDRWAALDGCSLEPSTATLKPGHREQRFTRCRGDAEVRAHMVAGAGHVWVADNDEMWAFFARHRR
jgi:polyhydroxybutyrate depolymerase